MDETKIELPGWLPWATTACLAALVACLGELWIIEKARTRLQRDQGLLAEAAMKGMENQLEAERIVSSRELADMRPAAEPLPGFQVALLAPPGGMPAILSASAPAMGVVVWDPSGKRGLVRLSGGSAQDPTRDYQLWLEGPGPQYPADCGIFHAPPQDGGAAIPIKVPVPIAAGCRFVLVDGKKGGAPTLEGAEAGGSIVLATLPFTGKIPDR